MIARVMSPWHQYWQANVTDRRWWLGVVLAGGIAGAGMLLASQPMALRWGLSPLTLAIVIGIVLGNTVFPLLDAHVAPGIDFAKGHLLRAGIVLYGLRVTVQQLLGIGWSGLLLDLIMLPSTFLLACYLGPRLFRLDKQTAQLIGAGSSICGAAAVLATAPVVKGPAYKVSVAVATVVVFGTIGMFLYPALYPYLGLNEHQYGMYAGATIHEVAQVVAAGKSVSEQAASTAVIEKMLRVMMLAPFLILLSARQASSMAHSTAGRFANITIPWFALGFVAVVLLHSWVSVPASWLQLLLHVDTLLLATAMAALGLRTHVNALREAGIRPLLLAVTLFVYLITMGLLLSHGLTQLFG